MDKVNKSQAKKMQKEYRNTHPKCWGLIEDNGIWRFCGMSPTICDHIPHRHGWERPRVYYPLCEAFQNNCHSGWKHQTDKKRVIELPGKSELRQFTVKWMAGEVMQSEVGMYMKGRTWFDPKSDIDMESTIEGMMDIMAEEMQSLYDNGLVLTERLT